MELVYSPWRVGAFSEWISMAQSASDDRFLSLFHIKYRTQREKSLAWTSMLTQAFARVHPYTELWSSSKHNCSIRFVSVCFGLLVLSHLHNSYSPSHLNMIIMAWKSTIYRGRERKPLPLCLHLLCFLIVLCSVAGEQNGISCRDRPTCSSALVPHSTKKSVRSGLGARSVS